MQIFKYPIEIGKFSHEMPIGAWILDAQMQGDKPCMWASVNTANEKVLRKFQVIGTGHEFDYDRKNYLSTFQQGEFVWHLFEIELPKGEQ